MSDVVEVIRRDPARLANPDVVKGIDQSIIGGIDGALSTVVRPEAALQPVAMSQSANEPRSI